MDDIVDLIFEMLWAISLEFRLLIGTMGVGALAAEYWPFGTDRSAVLDKFMVLSMALFAAFYLYRKFLRPKPAAAADRSHNART